MKRSITLGLLLIMGSMLYIGTTGQAVNTHNFYAATPTGTTTPGTLLWLPSSGAPSGPITVANQSATDFVYSGYYLTGGAVTFTIPSTAMYSTLIWTGHANGTNITQFQEYHLGYSNPTSILNVFDYTGTFLSSSGAITETPGSDFKVYMNVNGATTIVANCVSSAGYSSYQAVFTNRPNFVPLPGNSPASPNYVLGNVNSQGSATIYNSFLPTPTGTLPVGFSPTPYGILTNRAVTNFNVIIASTPIPVTIYTNGNDYAGLVVNTSSSLGSVTIFNSNGVTFNLLDRSSNNPVTLQNPITNPSSTYWGDVADSVYVVFSGTQGTTLTCGFTYDVLPVYAKAMYELQKFQLYGTNTPTFTFTPTGSPWYTYTPTSTPTPSLQYFNAAIVVSAPVTIAAPSTNFKTNLNCLLQNFGTGYGSVTLSCGSTNIYYFSPGDSIPITVNSMIFGNGVTFFPTSTNAAVSCNITGFTSLSSQ